MKSIKKLLAFSLYLLLVAALMHFDIRKLIDVRQIILVLLGMVILYFPSYIEQGHKKIHPALLGGTALWAGSLQTFILLFILLSETTNIEELFPKIALMCRPLLYGFCIWQILDGKIENLQAENKPKEEKQNMDISKKNLQNATAPKSSNPIENPTKQDLQETYSKTDNDIVKINPIAHKKQCTAAEIAEVLKTLGLSKREVEVAVLVTKGMSNAEIAVALCISETTVKKHLSNIFGKLEIGKREDVIRKVLNYDENRN